MKNFLINAFKLISLVLALILFFGGLLFLSVSIDDGYPEFQIAKTKNFIWSITSFVSATTIFITILFKAGNRIKTILLGTTAILLLTSILVRSKCSDLKVVIPIPDNIRNAKVYWDKPILAEKSSDITSCVASMEAERILEPGLGQSYSNPHRQFTLIPENYVFSVEGSFRVKPFLESSDGFFGQQPRTYLILKDKDDNRYLLNNEPRLYTGRSVITSNSKKGANLHIEYGD